MHTATTSILCVETDLPAHWAAEESRLVKLRLRNLSGVDLRQVHVRTTWSGTVRADDLWRKVGNLRRGAVVEHALHIPAPPGWEDQFQIEVQVEVGSFLKLELWSEKTDVKARPRPGAGGGIMVDMRGAGIQGDKLGSGQLLAEGGSGVGHVVTVHGSNPQREFQQWLDADPAAGKIRELPQFIAHEVCHPWTSHAGIELCGIAKGDFMMGASREDAEADPEEKVRREVSLSRSFWMGRYPVTMAEYARVMGCAPPVTLAGHKGDDMPAACVTWGEAMAFCEQLTSLEHAAGALPPGYGYRLPTEAQWEYACRAGTTGPHYGPLEKIGAVKMNHGGMGAVGRFEANAWGLRDMLGLVFEWCLDAYGSYRSLEVEDPVREVPDAGQPLKRVVRGGCYQGPDGFARASARHGRDPMGSSHRIGFRVVLAGS